ncbi:hypothetical protein [Flavobacterium saliperosum]|uniref:Guanylate cyclase domain-containing protein n=2 Tax=Flavobacterium saliperosum TaxID=329186 RepID=A0A1G4WAP9_9FLAO|nr:hypothetical protein [Flavobacterium saliperosum]SCX19594.1 hypothetical protein SAMN02927925_02807 [Flavobacterium saliperosum]
MSETKKTNWKTTDKRFVAFLDILGFKDKVMRNTHNEIYDELTKLSKAKSFIEETASKSHDGEVYKDADIYIVSFSDSIVIFSKNDDFENFEFFLISVRYLFANAIVNNIALKGGIAHGEISLNKKEQIYFGQPIIDAYLIEEDVNYFGVVAHNSIDKYIETAESNYTNSKIMERILFREKTPLKCGKIKHINLDWFIMSIKYDANENQKTKIIDILNRFNLTASGSARRYVDNTIELFEDLSSKEKINLKPLDPL